MPKESKSKEISMTNTKKEMIEAYNTLLKQMEEKKSMEMKPEEKAAAVEKKAVIEKADSVSSEKIMKDIAALKYEFGSVLSNLSEKLDDETAKYQTIKKAVELKETELKEIYEIQKQASSLAALIETQNQKKEEFEIEMDGQKEELENEIFEKRIEWDKEKKQHDFEIKERNEREQKQRSREKEEFEYDFNQKKKQFEDEFNIKKATLERELANMKEETEKSLSEREKIIAESETELNELRQKVTAYPDELNNAIENAVKSATEKIIMESEHKESMLKAQFEGEKQVLLTKIDSQEKLINQQNKQIEKLTEQIEKSYGQVQDIAIKAVSGSGKTVFAGIREDSGIRNEGEK